LCFFVCIRLVLLQRIKKLEEKISIGYKAQTLQASLVTRSFSVNFNFLGRKTICCLNKTKSFIELEFWDYFKT